MNLLAITLMAFESAEANDEREDGSVERGLR